MNRVSAGILLSSALVVWTAALQAAEAAGPAEKEHMGIDKLPAINQLPDPFLMNDGSHVKSQQDWAKQRTELRELFLAYEYGHMPTDATEVKATETSSTTDATTGALVKQFTLTMGPGGKVSAPLVLTIPPGTGPFPIIIKGDMCWGRVKPEMVANAVKRGYIVAEFDRTAIAADNKDARSSAVFQVYPDYDWGDLAAWAWGFSRVIDYVSTRDDVDRSKIIVTGHSRGGKATLLAGALDERVALTVPNGSGAGGGGLFRVQLPLAESLATVDTHFPWWFGPHFGQFIGHVDHLPFDQHELRALVAPRALLTTDSLDDLWANPMGAQISYMASKTVFDFLGVPERTGLHYRHGKHDQNEEDWTALLDFADWQLMGKKPAQSFDALPFPQVPSMFKWTAPVAK